MGSLLLLLAALAGWVWWQSRRIGELTRRIGELEKRLGAPASAPVAAPTPDTAPPASPPVYEPEDEPLLLTDRVPDDVLVLDTPLPEASNDVAPVEEAPLELTRVVRDEDDDKPLPPIPEAARPLPREPHIREQKLEQWLAENGLAWLGGGLFALGGILLVAFAAQQTWFTPQVRLWCAVALGVTLIGASEWVRRRPDAHALVGALLAGAGVAALYATAWGAHALYGLITWPAAATALAGAALLLLALSFVHGQPLGVLAIGAAMFTPVLTTYSSWPSFAVTLFVCGVATAGFLLAALKRWSWIALVTLAGLYFWFAAAIAVNEIGRALVLLTFASVGGVGLAFRRALPGDDENGALPWTRTRAVAPSIAICLSSVALFFVWTAVGSSGVGSVAGPAWVGAIFVAVAAAAVRVRWAMAAAFAVAVGMLTLGFMSYLGARYHPIGADFYPFILFASVFIVGSALGAKPHRRDRTLIAATGAIGAAVLTALAASTRDQWHAPEAWAPLFIGAAIMFAAAWSVARQVHDQTAATAVDFWAGAGAVLLLLGVESLFPGSIRTAGHASIAITLAAGFAWRGWRALRWGALAAATLAIAHALSNDLFGAALTSALPLWQALFALGISFGFLLCASFIVDRRAPRSATAESLSSAAVMVALIAAFLALRWIAQGRAGVTVDDFTEAALGALTLMAAAHIVLPRANAETGRIAALRGHVLMALGFVYGFMTCGMMLNPWWGAAPAIASGPPLLGSPTLAFAAPAALLLLTSNRLYLRQRMPARIYAVAGSVLALMWVLLELRRAFHGDAMSAGGVGVFEGACYGLAFLGAALGVAFAARFRAVRYTGPFTEDLHRSMRACAWGGIAISAIILLMTRHPWWGAHDWSASDALATGLAVLAQAVAVAMALVLGRLLSVSRDVEPTRFAAASAALVFAWSFGHSAIRWGLHLGAMDDGGPLIGVEGYAHALWPLAFVLLGSAITMRTPGRDTVRPYLYDLQALWAAMVWPALVFAALGALLLFNPWWGVTPATVSTWLNASFAIAGLLAAALLSFAAPRVPHIRAADWFARVATIAMVAHLFVAATLLVRAGFHGGAIAYSPAPDGAEMWAYSAVWALFGATALTIGMLRDNAVLRWCGLAILFATAAKVVIFDTARLSGIIRVASVLGVALVVTLTALAMRRFGRRPTDLLTVIPSGQNGTPRAPQ